MNIAAGLAILATTLGYAQASAEVAEAANAVEAAPPATNNGVSSYNWCGNRKWIALTFDDWWPSPAFDDILADLSANNMKASFFLAPGMSSPDADICTKIKKVVAAGHSINSRTSCDLKSSSHSFILIRFEHTPTFPSNFGCSTRD